MISTVLLIGTWLAFPWREQMGAVPGDVFAGSAGLTSYHFIGQLLTTLAALTLGIAAEKVLGRIRFVIIAALMYFVGIPLGMSSALVLERAGLNTWGSDVANEILLSPLPWLLGTAAVASAWMRPLWRRRTRVVLLSLTATMVLYAGTLLDVTVFSCVLLGLVAGLLVKRPIWVRTSDREARVLVAAAVLSTGMGPLVAALNPTAAGPFAEAVELLWKPDVNAETVEAVCSSDTVEACHETLVLAAHTGVGPLVANIMPLICQIVIAYGLMRGRRVAWWAALAVQVGAIAALFLAILRLTALGTNFAVDAGLLFTPWLAMILVLLLTRRRFTVTSAGYRRAGSVVALGLLVSSAAWVVGAWLWSAESLDHILAELPARLAPPIFTVAAVHQVLPEHPVMWFIYDWVSPIFWLSVTAGLGVLILSNARTKPEQDRARTMLTNGTGDHLSFMTLWEGNQHFFAQEDRGYVAYQARGTVAVTLGEPVVQSGSRAEIAREFEEFCSRQGLNVAWYSVGEEFSTECLGRGFNRVQVAQEEVVDTGEAPVTFSGKKFQNVRTARNTALKAGVEAQVATWDELSAAHRNAIVELSEAWVAEKPLPEMRFTLGTVEELAVPGTRLVLAVDQEDRLHAVTSWLPVYENGQVAGYVLDFMRRTPDALKGVTDFLLAETIAQAHEEGLGFISLSGAPLAGGGSEDSGALSGALDSLGAAMEPLYGFRSLAAAKSKFRPTTRNWFLCYDDELALGGIGLAITRCYLPNMRASHAIEALNQLRASRQDRQRESAAQKQSSSSGSTKA
ncbi:bifunctional lysylphosphatidylglycerol flippase/synthetase MprF [Corynebacterium tapiri]|uniref:DUF2156 domain-containing protein n=1 Tax=Corynebacterium tapiri TaxID=1448266 RepID=A0A5C4U709_9CORY|nr:phosphatidylglycerol lysyltransferase domain-containing protein [Corynebacterium tapiri]TNL99757.1 DUF2156 domain-containing protein [Corynebacterium tapiri]